MKAKFLLFLLTVLLLTSCSEEDSEPDLQEEANIETEVLFFNFSLNEVGDSFEWEYKIRFHNRSNFAVKGFPRISHRLSHDTETIITPGYTTETNPCPEIPAGGSCTVDFYRSGTVNPDLSEERVIIELVEADYFVYPAGYR